MGWFGAWLGQPQESTPTPPVLPSAGFYPDMRATAEELIAEFGQVGAIRRMVNSGPAHDPTLTPTDYPAVFVVLGYDESEIDGSLVQATDRKIYVSTESLTIEPTTSDKIVIGGTAFEIVKVMPLNPAGLVVYFEIQARS